MDRAAVIVVFAMAFVSCGCARARSAMPPDPTRKADPGPVEMAPIEPIKASINEGKIPHDLDTVRASYEVEQDPTAPLPAGPSLEPFAPAAPSSLPPRDGPSARPLQVPPALPSGATAPEAARAEGDPPPLKTSPSLDPGKPAARTAAMVGGTVITFRELKKELCRRMKCKPSDLAEVPRDDLNAMAKQTLDDLIDRVMILQEAKREIGKKPANWSLFTEHFEKQFAEKELPSLLRQEKVADEFELARKLDGRGESLDDAKTAFIEEAMAREMVMLRVHPMVERPGKPELDAYYLAHRNDPIFHRDALIVWHEILIAPREKEDKPAMRKRAEAIRARVLAGEDFRKLAQSESAGATAAKGGLWETAPNGYAVPAVNQVLNGLQPGQISGLIEGPRGLHLVRLTSRRKEGPATFVEVQKQIGDMLFQERFSKHVTTYLKKLRERTAISSPLFEGTESAPTTVQEKSPTDPQATRTSGPR